MDSDSLKEYSLWLMPEGEEAGTIKDLFVGIRKHINTVTFEPHVTLLGGLTLIESQIIERTNKLVAETSPFRISFTGIGETDNFYKPIFLKCEKTRELMRANKCAQNLFSADGLYTPHMSIIYGDINSIDKKEILESINPLIIQSLFFNVGSIFICKAFGKADQWKIIESFSL